MRVLVVEDSGVFAKAIANEIEENTDFEVLLARDMKSADDLLTAHGDKIDLAILDYVLPDAPDGEVVDLVVGRGVPSVVFSSRYDENLRDQLFAKEIVDYVVKDTPSSVEYVVSLLNRLYKNKFIKVMVVDDSTTVCAYLSTLLTRYQFQVIVANDGLEALEIFKENPDIKLIITDNTMPNLDGFELILELRKQRPKSELPIIGLSSTGNPLMSAKFIKYGANDFITKPFVPEEFSSRVFQQMELLEVHQELKDIANKDFLTGLNSRRNFFHEGQKLAADARAEGDPITVAMMDIDNFKKVNDSYGHDAGDIVLKKISALLSDQFSDGELVGRLGGEEFCVLAPSYSREQAEVAFEQLRQVIAGQDIDLGEKTISVTISIGVEWNGCDGLDMAISVADDMLYCVKNDGRNGVKFADAKSE